MPTYSANWHHALLARHLDRFARGECRRLIVSMPPQHGKSELVSRRLPPFILGLDPDQRVIGTSYGASLASDFNRDCQRVMDSDAYGRLFPQSALGERNIRTVAGPDALRNSEVFEVAGRLGSYRCAGVGGPISGKPADKIICDDLLKNREEADSPTVRNNVWRWFTSVVMARCHNDTGILMCATRWHPDDPIGRLVKLMEDDPTADRWEVLTLPAVREEAAHPEDPRQVGEALWPARHSLESLLRKKAASLTDWWSIYQQRPRAEGALEWPDEHFGWPGFWFDTWPDNCSLKVMALDPSCGRESKPGDYQALILFGRTPDGTEWVEADMGKRPMTAARDPAGRALTEGMVENAVEQYRRFKPEGLALETNTFQQLLTIPLRTEAKARKVDLKISPLNNYVAKNVRIRRLGDVLGRRGMRFRRTSGTRLLVEQLKQFPTADHDDGPDALEMARRVAIELHNGRQRKR